MPGLADNFGRMTSKDRIRILARLKFIEVKAGPYGPLGYVLIWNPYPVIKTHYEKRTPGISENLYHALLQRANEIRADDLV